MLEIQWEILYFFKRKEELEWHSKKCTVRCPPGDEIYRDEKLSIFEFDAKYQKVYTENCLISKFLWKFMVLGRKRYSFPFLTRRTTLNFWIISYWELCFYNSFFNSFETDHNRAMLVSAYNNCANHKMLSKMFAWFYDSHYS